ncbi:centriolar coiled-coil protein of isoform B [Patagioenas fasciata monilis]|uniref:Centriolar coiled-coil protein of isoform B n=1 Tax=Patagioenas fasciata monilis TaxID=372326 RepID=A0A1V4JF39_PATFA|nr:centriolar coiled-coil protein of isoform B [Patagioenas fasciata monilis]
MSAVRRPRISSVRGVAGCWFGAPCPLSLVNMKMEDYEIFCKKHLSRIQEEAIKRETSFTVQQKNISLIQFHGIPVLSPLLSLEKKKEVQQYKQKALDLETWRRNSQKRALLNRVQEILENVQIRKGPGGSDMNEAENTCPDLVSKAPADLAAPSDVGLCSDVGPVELAQTPGPPDSTGQVTPSVTQGAKAAEGNVFSEQSEGHRKATSCPRAASPDSAHDKLGSQKDPCGASLQNLLKKSRECVEKEQSKRSSKSNSKRSVSESHSDKENDGVKTTDSVKERAKLTGRTCTAPTLDKPSLNKSNTLLQGASAHTNSTSMSALSSFSKVDIPMRVGTPPPSADSDSDEEFKKTSMFDRDSSIVRSLTGSYSKLPSPEPSMSPKMHRRRPRPLSMGHIVISNPVNAYELSPKGKSRAMDLIMQDLADKNNVSESAPKFLLDLVNPNRAPGVHRNPSGPGDSVGVGRANRLSFGYSEGRAVLLAAPEGRAALDSRGTYKIETSADPVPPKSSEAFAISQAAGTQKLLAVNETKPSALLENSKCNSPVELNKSYDVENPSPLLMQSKNTCQQMDTPSVALASEQFPENSFEKVKRRLDLDAANCQKENSPCVVTAGMEEQEQQWLQDQKYAVRSVYIPKNSAPDSAAAEDILKTKMLAFEEMRKRLEEQHAQQLSILIAEQEREQEKLQKELEEQERKLKGMKIATAEIEISKVNINSRMELEWRKKSESSLLESVESELETVRHANSTSIGFAHAATPTSFASTSETSFFLWGPSGSGVIKTSVSRPSNRIKTRWTQVFSPEIQMKFDKITAVAKGFLTRRLLQTEKLKHLKQTVKDTMEFIRTFQSEAPLKRGNVSAQDASLHERVMAQLRAALFDIHDIFFTMEASERMNILRHDREVRKEKMLRLMDKVKSPRERVTLSTATQKSLDRKKYMKASEMGIPSKKIIIKQKTPESRVLQPNQGQNAPVHRLLCRQGSICRKNPKKEAKCCDNLRRQHSLG